MKILHVINSLSSGGAEKLVYDITRSMSSKDVQIEVLTLTNKNEVYTDELRKTGFIVHTLSTSKSIYNFIVITFLLIRFFRNHTYDLIHVHPFPSFYYISILKRYHIIGCSVIFHEHNKIRTFLPSDKLKNLTTASKFRIFARFLLIIVLL